MVAPVTVFIEREVDSKLRRSVGDSRILMRELHTTWYNTLSKSLFREAKERSTFLCFKTNARTISQEGSSPPLTLPHLHPFRTSQPGADCTIYIFLFFKKKSEQKLTLPLKKRKEKKRPMYLATIAGKSYLAHWRAKAPQAPTTWAWTFRRQGTL